MVARDEVATYNMYNELIFYATNTNFDITISMLSLIRRFCFFFYIIACCSKLLSVCLHLLSISFFITHKISNFFVEVIDMTLIPHYILH